MPDPTQFRVRHPSDAASYKAIDALDREHRLTSLPFPPPRGLPEPRLALAAALGNQGQAAIQAIEASGQIVFHSVGDTGNTRGPDPQNQVADKLVGDFDEADPREMPQFLFHLGDVIYNFGEDRYYYDQFYDPYRAYPAPIFALAGNHDGMVAPVDATPSVTAFLRNFCAERFERLPESGGLLRTAQIQPGVFFTFDAPFVRVLALYSGTLEDPGVIADDRIGASQLDYLRTALTRVRDDNYAGALILAHHHPAYTAGAKHGWSIELTAQIDAICAETGVWPHAVLSAHAHNFQRFTRTRGDGAQVPYIIAGNGGHGLARLSRRDQMPPRAPALIQQAAGSVDQVVLENYDDQNYGYLRLIADARQLRIEYHPASDGIRAKTPDDFITVDLATRRLVHFNSPQ
ncbi:MAG: metallophosphoesterase [Pseudomonadota bacterium]|nr:metallophosphoesterase [Pseudomonadota bacterium]